MYLCSKISGWGGGRELGWFDPSRGIDLYFYVWGIGWGYLLL